MLKNFIYLNEATLDSYLSALEDGLRGTVESRDATSRATKGGGSLKVANLQGEKAHEKEETVSRVDTPEARFERLLRLAHEDEELAGWITVTDPDSDLPGAGIGAIIEVECEVYIPEVIKALSPAGNLGKAVAQIEAISKLAPAFGSQLNGLPGQDQLDALKGMSSALGADAVFIGEVGDGDWTVSGNLLDSHLRGEAEGYARVIGKVTARLGADGWKPLLAFPGMNLLSREKRREMEQKGPGSGQEQNWLKGPALLLDVLAVYR